MKPILLNIEQYISSKLMLLLIATNTTTGLTLFNGWFKIDGLPDYTVMIWLGIAIIFDLITGVIKAIFKKQQRTSSGLRKTIKKFTQYGGVFIIATILGNIAIMQSDAVVPYAEYLGNGSIIFMIYIEITSICENLIAVDTNSKLSKFVIIPIYKILTIQLTKNTEIEFKDKEIDLDA